MSAAGGRCLAEVAEFLLDSAGDIPSIDWDRCASARFRSAVGRAYYAVFAAIKLSLSYHRVNFVFPRQNVHLKVRKAMEAVLGYHHPLVTLYKSLLRSRAAADYDVAHEITEAEANAVVDDALDALHELEGLSDKHLRAIADELFDLERTTGGSFAAVAGYQKPDAKRLLR